MNDRFSWVGKPAPKNYRRTHYKDTFYACTYESGMVYLGRGDIVYREGYDTEFEYIIGQHHSHYLKNRDGVVYFSQEEFSINEKDFCELMAGPPQTERLKLLTKLIDTVTPIEDIRYFRIIRQKDGPGLATDAHDTLIEITNEGIFKVYKDDNGLWDKP